MIKIDLDSLPLINKPESLQVIDATKLKAYLDCPRRFFYEYVLGYRTSPKSYHLSFGDAFHKGMEEIYKNGLHYYDANGVLHQPKQNWDQDLAFKAALAGATRFKELLSDWDEATLFPKTRERLEDSYSYYIRNYVDHKLYNVLDVETAGAVLINTDPERWLYFKMDVALEDKNSGEIWALEHKTGSGSSWKWSIQWELSYQIFIYSYALYIYYGDKATGVMVNGTHFKKNIKKPPFFEFDRLLIRKSIHQLSDWSGEANTVISRVEDDFAKLCEITEDSSSMPCFPRNSESCTKYYGCPYHSLCCSTRNPLAIQKYRPSGFEIDHWDPRNKLSEASKIFLPNPNDLERSTSNGK